MNPTNSRGLAALALVLALLPAAALAEDKPAGNPPAVTASTTPDRPATPVALHPADIHPSALIAGNWSGGGTISLSSGTRERLRCRARHTAGKDNKSLSISIRCASDSYKFDLSSNVVDRRGQIFGRWSEASNGVSGTLSGRATGNRISAVARGDSFTAGLSMTTNGNRQSVSITPRDVFITGVHIALVRVTASHAFQFKG
jgi:hypothetical protein